MWTYFTFHNVSINTNEEAFAFTDELPLHSIMFLLIRCRPKAKPL